jgi:hypothetical protein
VPALLRVLLTLRPLEEKRSPVILSRYHSHPHITATMANNKRKSPVPVLLHPIMGTMRRTTLTPVVFLQSLGTPAQQPQNVQHLVDCARVNVEEQLKRESDVRDNAEKGLFRNIRDLETKVDKLARLPD